MTPDRCAPAVSSTSHRPAGGAALLLAVVLAAPLACDGGDRTSGAEESATAGAVLSAPPRPDGPPPNVLLYVVDTLRADHLSLYGYERETSPRLEELAERSFVFESAYAPGPHTIPSITSLFSSRYPSALGGRLAPDGAARRTLAEAFREAGYDTAAFQANLLLFASHGYARGFDPYRIVRNDDAPGPGQADAGRLHAEALEWLRAREGGPFFLYIQSMDVHYPYDPPGSWAERFQPPDARTPQEQVVAHLPPDERAKAREEVEDMPPETLQWLVWNNPNRYDACIAYADHEIGELLDALREDGLDRRTIVAVTADHGEPLGQRGVLEHGLSLHEELVRVPLVLHIPWQSEARRVPEIVSLRDLGPTLLDLAGVPVPESFAGQSWTRPRDAQAPPLAIGERLDLHTSRPLAWYARQGPWKLILDGDGSRLYHLPSDPGEEKDVGSQHPEVAARLEDEIRRRSPAFAGSAAEPVPLDEGLSPEERRKLEEALRALGYAE